jgi:putative SOS response-associated peptidase YedK
MYKVEIRAARCLFGLAGLCGEWKSPGGYEVTTCTIITCAPNAVMASIHNRMPVILLPEDEDAWLDPDMTEVEAITSYLRPYPDELLEAVQAA